ncbi:CBS domain-containing protein [Streptomyces spiramyceticus]|uniref:CBS domain-containing protein n=1 Tax=Streptomyces spiramyceticus TaxID=299717 RepID=UPI00237B1D2B|nr:CBS domain-containing protein [Streptomyces spiramyceticus]
MNRPPHFVSDVMSHPVVAVLRGAAFKEMVEAMARWKVGMMPVIDAERRVVGVVSEADLLPGKEPGGSTAEELMSSPAVTIHEDATLAQAARTMAVQHLKSLPVVDAAGRISGVVSRSDLLKVFLRPDEDLAAEIRREVVKRLFPEPGAEVHVRVDNGVVTLSGTLPDTRLIPVATRLVRAVPGVVDVEWALDD